jgi:hypothetical protein
VTRGEAALYIVTCIIAFAIHPAMDFTRVSGLLVWGAVSIAGFIVMLAVAFNARALGFPLRGIVVGAIAYLVPLALVFFFTTAIWRDPSGAPFLLALPVLALGLVAPFGFPFAVAFAMVALGARNAWRRGDRGLVATYAAVPICAILCFASGPFVADANEIAFVAPTLDAALQSGTALSPPYYSENAAVVVVRRDHRPAVVAYVMPRDAWAASTADADIVARDLAGVGRKRLGEMLLNARAPGDGDCTSDARSMGGAYYDVVVDCDRR